MAGTGDTFTYIGLGQLGSQHVAQDRELSGTGVPFDYDFPSVGAALPLKVSGVEGVQNVDINSPNIDFTWNQPTMVTVPLASEIYTG